MDTKNCKKQCCRILRRTRFGLELGSERGVRSIHFQPVRFRLDAIFAENPPRIKSHEKKIHKDRNLSNPSRIEPTLSNGFTRPFEGPQLPSLGPRSLRSHCDMKAQLSSAVAGLRERLLPTTNNMYFEVHKPHNHFS